MKMKQISDTTLKITISMDDLAERGMEVADFLIPQEKTEDFFYTVLDELDLPDSFKNSGMLSFRVTPKQDRIDVFVTMTQMGQEMNLDKLSHLEDISHMSPEDFFKNLEETMRAQGNTEALDQLAAIEAAEEMAEEAAAEVAIPDDYIHYVLQFDKLADAVEFVETVDFPVEASELYKATDGYHMTVLISLENQPAYYAKVIMARLLEHAKASTRTRAYLQEHAAILSMYDAINDLRAVRMA